MQMIPGPMAWFTRENFAAHRALDPTGLQATFDEWLAAAKRLIQEAKRHSIEAIPVILDPDELAAWCRARGTDVDSKSRAAFAAELLFKHPNGETGAGH